MFQLSDMRHFHYITYSVKDLVIPIRLVVLQTKYKYLDILDGNIYNSTWRDESSSEFLCPLETSKQNRYSKTAEEIRTTFKVYFCGPGEVPWQWKVLI